MADEHVVPVPVVECGSQPDDPCVLAGEEAGGVIAVWGGVPGTEDAARVPCLDPFGDFGGDGAGGDDGAFGAFCRAEVEGEDREGVAGQDDGVWPFGLPGHPEAAARGRLPGCGGEGFDAGGLAGGVPADEHGIGVTVGMDQAKVPAQRDERVAEAAPLDEVSPQRGPTGVPGRHRCLTLTVRERRVTRQIVEEVEGGPHWASERMDHQFDGVGSPFCAKMVVEHEAVDGEDRYRPPTTEVTTPQSGPLASAALRPSTSLPKEPTML